MGYLLLPNECVGVIAGVWLSRFGRWDDSGQYELNTSRGKRPDGKWSSASSSSRSAIERLPDRWFAFRMLVASLERKKISIGDRVLLFAKSYQTNRFAPNRYRLVRPYHAFLRMPNVWAQKKTARFRAASLIQLALNYRLAGTWPLAMAGFAWAASFPTIHRRTGEATKIELYVPTTIPTKRANAKL